MISIQHLQEQESLAAMERQRQAVSAQANQAWCARRDRDAFQQKLTELRTQNGFLAEGDMGQPTASWIFVLFIPAAFVLDVALFGPAVREITGRGNDVTAALLWLAVPFALVLAEVVVSIWRYLARSVGSMSSPAVLTMVGVLFALVMPGLVLATQAASYAAEDAQSSATKLMVICRITSLTALSFGLHIVLLTSGRQLYEAVVFAAASLRQWSLGAKMRRANRAYDALFLGTADAVVAYDAVQRTHVRRFTKPEPAVFDERTLDILNEIYRRNAAAPHPAATGAQEGGAQEAAPGADFREYEEEVRP